MENLNVGFIGFGLIGGSIAKALKAKTKNCRITVYNYHKQPNASLELAGSEGIVDIVTQELSTAFPECDLIFLCAPVRRNIAYLKQLKPLIKPGCILTDVGSVKGNICHEVFNLGMASSFIGGHPMAGSERTGYEASSPLILENAYYILTPTEITPTSMVDKMTGLIQDIGAIPIVLDPSEHDDITAAISHVPHIIAAALVNMVKENDGPDGRMLSLAAGGFKDITRIASSSPEMWQDICLTNPDSILKFLTVYKMALTQAENEIRSGSRNGLYRYFESAKDYRDSIPNSNGAIFNRIYEVYADLIDETGAIASLATLLASNGISIKNIGIIHNREFQDGVLRIELYNQASCEKAIMLLKKHHYRIYER